MFRKLMCNGVWSVLAGCALFSALVFSGPQARAYKPTDPEVQRMINAGIAFLRTPEAEKGFHDGTGLPLLIAYAIYKVEHDAQDPLVVKGIKQAQALAGRSLQQMRSSSPANYEMSVAVLLLAEVDPLGYSQELTKLRDALLAGQRPHGGFGYYTEQAGDTSQTQYVMLALWTLEKNGFEIPATAVAKLVQYLILTQDPRGGWGYKGILANSPTALVPQDNRINQSLSMGGGGSLLMAGELFGFWSSADAAQAAAGLPPAFRDAKEQAERRRRAQAAGTKPDTLLTVIKRLEGYLANPVSTWVIRDYYRIYTLERYRSFLEIATGKVEEEPAWYNAGVNDLRSKQSPDGAWGKIDARGSNRPNDEPGVATSFAVLFLIRSTKKSIVTLSQATAQGGYGIPKDTTEIRMEGGQVKGTPVAGAIDGLLGLLEADGADELDGRSIPDDLKLASDPEELRKQLDRLERLVRGSQSWQARRVAARLLGQSGELRVVPALIFALSDPDKTVQRFARDGLRFVSRRFDGFGMPDEPSEQEVRDAQNAWRQWYLSLDPGYVFLDSES